MATSNLSVGKVVADIAAVAADDAAEPNTVVLWWAEVDWPVLLGDIQTSILSLQPAVGMGHAQSQCSPTLRPMSALICGSSCPGLIAAGGCPWLRPQPRSGWSAAAASWQLPAGALPGAAAMPAQTQIWGGLCGNLSVSRGEAIHAALTFVTSTADAETIICSETVSAAQLNAAALRPGLTVGSTAELPHISSQCIAAQLQLSSMKASGPS